MKTSLYKLSFRHQPSHRLWMAYTNGASHPSWMAFCMSDATLGLSRRRFLQAVAQVGAMSALPPLTAATALGKGSVPPSERITLGGIGIGHRGTYDLGCFLEQPDVQVGGHRRREGRPPHRRQGHGRRQVWQSGLRRLSRPARAAGPRRHRRRADRHRSELARHRGQPGGQRRQGRVLREALHEEYRPKPGAGRDLPADRPGLPGRHPAAELAALRLCRRIGPPRPAGQTSHRLRPPVRAGNRHERLGAARAGAGQGGNRLGPLFGAGSLAAVQPGAARRIQFREGRRTGRWRVPRVGLP